MKITAAMFRAMNKRKKPFDPLTSKKRVVKETRQTVADPREKDYPEDLDNLTEFERKLMK